MASLLQSTINSMRFGRDVCGNITSTAFGCDTLRDNNTCSVAVGYCSGATVYTVGVNICRPTKAVFIGNGAGRFSYGPSNVGFGAGSFGGFSNRCRGVAVGFRAFPGFSYGRDSTAIGAFATENGHHNVQTVAIGFGAIKGEPGPPVRRGGDNMTAIGAYALCKGGPNSYNANLNIAIGTNSSKQVLNGTRNITVGFCSGYSSDFSNTIVVGANAAVSADNHTVWGGVNNSVCNCIWANWSTFSDANDKTDVESLTDNEGIDFITRLRPVSYNLDLRGKYVHNCGYEYGIKDGSQANEKKSYGLIAQEVRGVMDDLDLEFAGVGYDEAKDIYNMTMEEFIAPITKAIQNLDARTQKLIAKVETL